MDIEAEILKLIVEDGPSTLVLYLLLRRPLAAALRELAHLRGWVRLLLRHHGLDPNPTILEMPDAALVLPPREPGAPVHRDHEPTPVEGLR